MFRLPIASVTRRVLSAPMAQASSTICKRTFASFTPLRPTLSARPTAFLTRPTLSPFAPATAPTESAIADLVPRSAITSHPALAQIRCGPRNTMQGSTRLVQLRRHGWLRRMKSKTGRKIIMRRRQKGRKELGCSV
ncbi:hypothetical protein B0T11DRAFT_285333 [Plectosphaerella cucumerina]|uniref:Ribosomal protein L34 n=1 Tax=Plectosphaerella cucumerina TaxID=40658 RepID=A0A8K0T9T8_9PEZI|nr:hypothetical protein B0T11DRAFT_285333 [Plectosphaerella cucumerina]